MGNSRDKKLYSKSKLTMTGWFNVHWKGMNKRIKDLMKEIKNNPKIKIGNFKFPEPQELKLRLKDMLEDEVDEKYYLKDDTVKSLIKNIKGDKVKEIGFIPRTNGTQHQSNTIYSPEGYNTTKILEEPKIIKEGNIYPSKGQNGNIYNVDGLSPTISSGNTDTKGSGGIGSNNAPKIIKEFRIRKLTPKECWRLQGFSDEQFAKAEKVNSNTQLYKQAGNSITVNVLEAIYDKMIEYGYMGVINEKTYNN